MTTTYIKDSSQETLRAMIEQEYIDYLNRRTRPNTAKAYITALEEWFNWLEDKEPNRKTAQLYIDVLEALGKAPNTVNVKANAIKKWFRWKGIPILLDSPGVQIKEPEYVKLEEFERLVAACRDTLDRVLIIVLFDTGCRINEILELELNGIDRKNGLITVIRKGGRLARVNISQKALDELDYWLSVRKSNSKKVFMGLAYSKAWRRIRALGKRAKIPVHPHMFRHSRAIQMLDENATLHDVQEHLGHASISTTANIYGRHMPVDLKKRIPKW